MNSEERRLRAEWLDVTSEQILKEMGVIYKYYTRHLTDTDANLIYHGLLVETIFYKMYMSILEAVSDDAKDEQMKELIENMKHFRSKVRSEEEMWGLIHEKKAQ